MRSCDSESRISYGVIPSSRSGTLSRNRSRPFPPRPAISTDELVRPAAPMSWMPTTASVWNSSRQASSSSFSMNGSPTCTVGRFSSVEASNSAEAMVAPWMPSRPVFAPTYITGFPTPAAVPRKILSAGRMPSVNAFTRQLPL
jgi:hypothetical protein